MGDVDKLLSSEEEASSPMFVELVVTTSPSDQEWVMPLEMGDQNFKYSQHRPSKLSHEEAQGFRKIPVCIL